MNIGTLDGGRGTGWEPLPRRERAVFWIIDRLEGDQVVCSNDSRQTRDLPRNTLPQGVKEGDVLVERGGHYERDDQETARRRQDSANLVKGMWA